MSVLADLQLALTPLSIPMETGVFTEAAPNQYIVVHVIQALVDQSLPVLFL